MMYTTKQCHFCTNKKVAIDYKDSELLKGFLSSHKKIAKRKRSGLCAKHERKVAMAIKRARIMALLPFVPA